MRRILPYLTLLLALLAGACSDPGPSPWAVEESDPEPRSTTESEPVDDTARDVPVDEQPTRSATATIVEEPCTADEERCGRILVPQLPDDPDLVALEFRLSNADAAGVPLVVLDAGFEPFTPTAEDFPGRPLLVLGSRFVWPGGPSLSCPEWFDLEADTPNPVVADATGRCADRLAAAGIDLRGTLRDQQVRDAVTALDLLGITTFDLVASADRADLVPAIDAAFEVGAAVLLEPALVPTDPVASTVERLTRALDFAWDACRAAPSDRCDPAGTIDDFLDRVAALDDAPLPFTLGFEDEEQEIDRGWLVSSLHREGTRPETVGFFPTLHRALIEGDATTVSEFVSIGSSHRANTDHLAQACSRLTSTVDDFAAVPVALRLDAVDAVEFFEANCPRWVVGDAPALDHAPDLVVITESTPDRAAIEGLGAPLVVQPTVGSPTHDCVVGAITSFLAGEDPAAAACTRPFEIAGGTDVDLVEGRYVYDDDVTISLLVPESWNDSGFGTWWRDADPIDPTNLDVYYFVSDEPEQAREEFVAEWSITDPALSQGRYGAREWLLASGGDGLDPDGDLRQTVAVTQFDDAIVAMILQSDGDEHDALIESVLHPALTDAVIVD